MLNLLPHLAGKQHILWDWNGTLLNDVDLCVDIISGMLRDQGLVPITKATYLARFRFPISDYYEEIGFSYEKVPYAELTARFMARYKQEMHHRARLYQGVEGILAELAASGIACSVLSAAHEGDLLMLLEAHGIRHHFTHVYGLGDHFAVSKVERGRQLLAALAIEPAALMLVGDTDHDLEVADALGIDALLLDAGHQAYERLTARHHRVLRR